MFTNSQIRCATKAFQNGPCPTQFLAQFKKIKMLDHESLKIFKYKKHEILELFLFSEQLFVQCFGQGFCITNTNYAWAFGKKHRPS